MAADGAVLVVGGDGLVGTAVARRLEGDGVAVVRTSRRGTPGTVPLDLAASPESWTVPRGLRGAVLAAAVTSTQQCRDHAVETHRVNVDATVELARRLSSGGTRVVLLSTNMVFDGTVAATPADAPRSPMTAYGRMKAEAEEAILATCLEAVVLRLTKVLPSTLPLIASWRDAWTRGEPVRPFSDLMLAPVSPAHAAEAIAAVTLASHPDRIVQCSATADVSYADVARRLAAAWGHGTSLVEPVSVAASGVVLEHVPRHTTLAAGTLQAVFGIETPDPWVAVDAVALAEHGVR